MNNDTLVSKPKTLHKVLNIILMLFNLYSAHSLTMIIIVMRSMHIDPHRDPQTGVYIGSALFDFLLRKEFIIIPVLFIVGMIIKEFKVKVFKKRVYINLLILAGIYTHMLLLMSIPFFFLGLIE